MGIDLLGRLPRPRSGSFLFARKIPPSTEVIQRKELKADDPQIIALIARLQEVFCDVTLYKQLLGCRDTEAQRALDVFQWLLDSPGLDSTFRRSLIVAAQRLSAKSGLYPVCYELKNIVPEDEHPLASGGFADIYKADFNGQKVCLKAVRMYRDTDVEHFLKQFAKEAILWGQLSHPNVLAIYGLYRFQRRICLVSPWMDAGDITAYLKSRLDAPRIQLTFDVAQGLAYLHVNGIIHGDLKGRNILVDNEGRARLADFGISSVSDSKIPAWTSHSSAASTGGSVRWQAPELFDVENDQAVSNSVASDVYAWSCVCYEIFSGDVPFATIQRDTAVMLQVKFGARPARPSDSSPSWSKWGLTESIWSLMQDCWQEDPTMRPTVYQIIGQLKPDYTLDMETSNTSIFLSPSNFRGRLSEPLDLIALQSLEKLLHKEDDNETALPADISTPAVPNFSRPFGQEPHTASTDPSKDADRNPGPLRSSPQELTLSSESTASTLVVPVNIDLAGPHPAKEDPSVSNAASILPKRVPAESIFKIFKGRGRDKGANIVRTPAPADIWNNPFTVPTLPLNETPDEKRTREAQEAQAKRVSDLIDEEIKAEALKQKGVVNVLLLGQSQSGKSTIVKNFRMNFARAEWNAERPFWRAVIQVNLVHSILHIFDTLEAERDNIPLSSMLDPLHHYSVHQFKVTTPGALLSKDMYNALRSRLRTVEEILVRHLGNRSGEVVDSRRNWVWEDALREQKGQGNGPSQSAEGTMDDATEMIASCGKDMKALWSDAEVRDILTQRKVWPEESPGFFLNDIERIATLTYEPTDDDVLRARLHTRGVQEHTIRIDQDSSSVFGNVVHGNKFGYKWIFHVVEGPRYAPWLQYLEAHAIIFVAPISCFDERLPRDPTVNRLEDSVRLWSTLCGSRLLESTTLILFLNKCDLLAHKLKRGVQVNKFIPTYGERPNETTAVVQYLRAKFKAIHRKESRLPRASYYYTTTLTDATDTAKRLHEVRDNIVTKHLKNATLV